jgi:hypothetical protein
VLDGAVLAVSGLPRVGANVAGANAVAGTWAVAGSGADVGGGALGGASGSAIPTTSLTESSVVAARKVQGRVLGAGAGTWHSSGGHCCGAKWRSSKTML